MGDRGELLEHAADVAPDGGPMDAEDGGNSSTRAPSGEPEAFAGRELDDLQPPWRRQSASLDPTRSVAQGRNART
jgi:hypothetical protein